MTNNKQKLLEFFMISLMILSLFEISFISATNLGGIKPLPMDKGSIAIKTDINSKSLNYNRDNINTNFILKDENGNILKDYLFFKDTKEGYEFGYNDLSKTQIKKYSYLINSKTPLVMLKGSYNESKNIYHYPIFYNYKHLGNMQEERTMYNFKDICSKFYSNCSFSLSKDKLSGEIDFYSTGNIDPIINVVLGCITINQSGYYLQGSDLNADGICIVITASDVYYDGNGNTIYYDNLAQTNIAGVYVVGNQKNITVRNVNFNDNGGGGGQDNSGFYSDSDLNNSLIDNNTFWFTSSSYNVGSPIAFDTSFATSYNNIFSNNQVDLTYGFSYSVFSVLFSVNSSYINNSATSTQGGYLYNFMAGSQGNGYYSNGDSYIGNRLYPSSADIQQGWSIEGGNNNLFLNNDINTTGATFYFAGGDTNSRYIGNKFNSQTSTIMTGNFDIHNNTYKDNIFSGYGYGFQFDIWNHVGYCYNNVFDNNSFNIEGGNWDYFESQSNYNSPFGCVNTTFKNQNIGETIFINSSFNYENNYGKISFNPNITGDILNLSKDIKISYNLAYVNSSISQLNKSANITLYNIPINTNVTILRNGVLCNPLICSNLNNVTSIVNLSNYDYSFSVTGWSNYSIDGNYIAPIPSPLPSPSISPSPTIPFSISNFQLDFTQPIYLILLILIFIVIVLLMFARLFVFAGFLTLILGFMLLFSNINLIISFLAIAIGIVIIFVTRKKK